MAEMTVKQYLTNLEDGLNTELKDNAKALPANFNTQRFILNCISVVKDNLKNFNGIEQQTVVTTLAKGAYLGLDFFNGECYAIAYKGQVQFQTDYKGEIKLCKRFSKNPIKDIYAKNVREEDFFEEEIANGKQTVNFKPKPFNNGKIIGSFAVVLFKDGSMMYDTMSVEEIESVRNNYSKAKDSQAWKNSYGEMCKKTVLRRLCKLIDLDFDNIEQQKAFVDGGDVDFSENHGTEEKYRNYDDAVVDAFMNVTEISSEPIEEPAQETPQA